MRFVKQSLVRIPGTAECACRRRSNVGRHNTYQAPVCQPVAADGATRRR